jgi:hypothetical protein
MWLSSLLPPSTTTAAMHMDLQIEDAWAGAPRHMACLYLPIAIGGICWSRSVRSITICSLSHHVATTPAQKEPKKKKSLGPWG